MFMTANLISIKTNFRHVFIDEAGQALEQETLIPITRFGQQNTRIILSGDHEQLGKLFLKLIN